MDIKLKGALRAEVREMKKRLAYILGVSVREVEMRTSEEGLCAYVRGERFVMDLYNL